MSTDALGLGNCQTKTNISAESMMLNLNIAEIIPDQGNMQRKLVVGDLVIELLDSKLQKYMCDMKGRVINKKGHLYCFCSSLVVVYLGKYWL
jgi:hypothetical protein